ncbi:MAG: DUF481 domain-containing protein [Opitutaceae bacterium]
MRFGFSLRILFGLALAPGLGGLALPALRAADILVLSNGDRLTGHLLKHANGLYYFRSDLLGDVEVQDTSATVRQIPASPVPPNSMVGLPPESATAKTAAKARARALVVKKKPAVTPWTGKVEIGYDNQTANDIRTTSTSILAQLDRTIYANDYLIKARYLHGKTGDVSTNAEEDGEFRLRHNLSSGFFTQSDTTETTNKLQLINFEGVENLGLGYKLLSSSRQVVDIGGGLSGQYLDAEGIEQGVDYLGNAFQDYTYKITGRYTLLEDTSVEYSPEDRARYGLVSDPTIVGPPDERDYAYKVHATLEGKINAHLSLNLHWGYEFNNAILDPDARGEERITTTLGYGF